MMVGDSRDLPLFNANNARRRAEQDSILLANRIRLLRNEEEKARRKIRETEGKTKEIIDVRRRCDESRRMREADDARREALECELRAKAAGVREEQQRKIQMAQRDLLRQKAIASAAQKQEREAHKQFIQHEQDEATAEAAAKALRVRKELQASERQRARSEGARLEAGRANFQEKLAREEDARRSNQQLISRMEKEEADLIQRLQRSQERHRVAFAQLEDALAGGSPTPNGGSPSQNGGASASSSRCPSSLDHVPVSELPTSTVGKTNSLSASSCASISVETRATASRPPRPRVSASPSPAPAVVSAAARVTPRRRPTSAPRAASVPPLRSSVPSKLHGGGYGKGVSALRDNSATSICSTASGGLGPESAASGPGSGLSTPSSAAPAPITYTTMDGMQLEIPPEEDLDLDKLLSGL